MAKSFRIWAGVLFLLTAIRPAAAQQLRADTLERTSVQVAVKKQHQVYRGNASLVLKDCTLRADRIDVYSTGGAQEKVVATGHVRLAVTKTPPLANFTLVARSADYNAANNEVNLAGDVRFTRGATGFVQGAGKAVIGQALTLAARTVTYHSVERTTGTTLEYTLDDPSVLCFWPIDQDPLMAKAFSYLEKQHRIMANKATRKR